MGKAAPIKRRKPTCFRRLSLIKHDNRILGAFWYSTYRNASTFVLGMQSKNSTSARMRKSIIPDFV